MCFDLSLPIGWGELGTIATTIGILVAICGNHQSRKQFQKNMEKQEQAINLSLFDARNEILEKVKKSDFSFSMDRVSFLFDAETMRLIKEYEKLDREMNIKVQLKEDYKSAVRLAAGNSENDSEAKDYEKRFTSFLKLRKGVNISADEYQEMREGIRNKKMYIDSHAQIPAGHYSYIDLDDEYSRLYTEQQSTKEQIIKSIKTQIEQSVPRTE